MSYLLTAIFRNLTLSTGRTGVSSWTAETPHGTLPIIITSEDRADFSGAINYLGYECEFNASVSKTDQFTASFSPENMLNGTMFMLMSWVQSGGQMCILLTDVVISGSDGTENAC